MASRKSYTNTRTGATRLSSSPLGFPFVPTPKDDAAQDDAQGDAPKGDAPKGDAKGAGK